MRKEAGRPETDCDWLRPLLRHCLSLLENTGWSLISNFISLQLLTPNGQCSQCNEKVLEYVFWNAETVQSLQSCRNSACGLEFNATPLSLRALAEATVGVNPTGRRMEPSLQLGPKPELRESPYLACRSCFRVAAAFHTETQLDNGISSGNWDSKSGRTSLSLVSM